MLTHQRIPLLLAKLKQQQLKPLFHLAIPGFPQSDHTVNKLCGDADSFWNTIMQAYRPQVILKTQPPVCLDYRAQNRPKLSSEASLTSFGKKSLANMLFHHRIPIPSTALLLYLSLLRQTTQMVKHPLSLHQMSYAIYCPIEVPSYTIASALLTMSL